MKPTGSLPATCPPPASSPSLPPAISPHDRCCQRPDYSRRDFIRTAAAGLTASAIAPAVASVTSPGAAAAAQAVADRLVDAHVHVWTDQLTRYPIDPAFQPSDMQPATFPPETLLSLCRPHRVDRVVLIQMSYYRFDNRYLLDVIARQPDVFVGIGVIDETASGVTRTIHDLARRGVRGFRIHPSDQDLQRWIGSAGMAELWSTCADQQLAVCPLINPVALPLIEQMCQRFPRTTVVIDHFARIGIDGTLPPAQIDQLCRLARFNQVYVKTSAFYALGAKKSPYTDLIPLIRRVRDAFGAKRLMWGSDCPFQVEDGHRYLDSLALIRDRIDFLSRDEREAILRDTAAGLFFGG